MCLLDLNNDLAFHPEQDPGHDPDRDRDLNLDISTPALSTNRLRNFLRRVRYSAALMNLTLAIYVSRRVMLRL